MPRGRMLNKHSIPIRVRLYVIQRDECRCKYCGKKGEFVYRFGKPCVVENLNNINLKENYFYNGKDNIVLACRKCNLSKSYKELKIWQEKE